MRKIILSFLLLFTLGSAFCQLNNYDISQYLYPEVSRTTFLVSPELFFNSRNFINQEKEEQLNLSTSAERQHIANSRKKQTSNYLHLNLGYRSELDSGIKKNEFNTGYYFQLENRYFRKDRQFFELGLTSQASYENASTSGEGVKDQIGSAHRFSPRIGWGRIENVTDSWHAWSILQTLEDKGYLNKDLTDEDINQFALELSRIKNLRNQDFRLEDIMEYEALYKYVVEEKIIDLKEFVSFAILQDAYEYESFATRTSGNTFKAGLDLYNQRVSLIQNSDDAAAYDIYSVVAEYERRKVIKNKFQIDQIYSAEGGFWNFNPDRISGFNRTTFLGIYGTILFGYYPSQRSNWRIGPYLSYREYFDSEVADIYTGININGSYYFSPKLRLNFSSRLTFYNLNNGAELLSDNYNTNANLGVNYFIR